MASYLLSTCATCVLLSTAALSAMEIPTKLIASGVAMPVINIGTGIWPWENENASEIVGKWIRQGGRGVDSAWIYLDQKYIASAIAQTDILRDSLFLTSKTPGCLQVKSAVERDLKALGTSYIDLMLLHFDLPAVACPGAWKILEGFLADGTLRAIGVSNFDRRGLEKIMRTANVVPAVNQIKLNVFSHDEDTISYCTENNITVEAYSPLGGTAPGSPSVFTDPTIGAIASANNVSAAQVALRWIIQRGHILTVLSGNPAHQANDADIFNFTLSLDEIGQLDQIQNQMA